MDNHNYRVIYTNAARKDLDEIFLGIYERSLSARRASRTVDTIQAEIDHCLSYMPQNYMQVDDDNLAALGYRWFTAKYGYRVFFIVNEKKSTAVVRRIIHGNREWLPILQQDAESLSAAKF